jgi:hypothetical protein
VGIVFLMPAIFHGRALAKTVPIRTQIGGQRRRSRRAHPSPEWLIQTELMGFGSTLPKMETGNFP